MCTIFTIRKIILKFQDCIIPASVLHARKDITVNLVEIHQKQENVTRVTSVFGVQLVSSKKSVLQENIVHLVPIHPRTVLWALTLTPPACGKKISVPIAQLAHIVLKEDERIPQGSAGQVITVQLVPRWTMLFRVLLAYIAP